MGVGHEVIEGSHLLVATGRRPNADTLALDRAGVTLRDEGAIPVDERMRTSADGVWAIGDVNGEQPFTRACQEEARVAYADTFGSGTDGSIACHSATPCSPTARSARSA